MPNRLDLLARDRITAENIPEFAFPVAQFIHEVRPDYIIACDTGARLFGVAVKMMYHELYGKFPTKDGKMHFRKLSRKIPKERMRSTLEPDIVRMLEQTEFPTVLFLDDWISTGETERGIRELVEEISEGQITVLYGVMRGTGADISGGPISSSFAEFTDRPELIGVDYDVNNLGKSVHSQRARVYRLEMSANIKNFVRSLQNPQKPKPEPIYTSY